MLIDKVKRKTADNFANAITHLLSPIARHIYPMYPDDGKEFATHETIAKELKVCSSLCFIELRTD
jgi:IS30 family transposase